MKTYFSFKSDCDEIERIGLLIGTDLIGQTDVEKLFKYHLAGYSNATFYYGLYLLLNIKSEELALLWLKSDKKQPMHKNLQ